MNRVLLSLFPAMWIFALGLPCVAQPRADMENNRPTQPLNLFGIEVGGFLGIADSKAGKYDCVRKPTFGFTPKPGMDFCLRIQKTLPTEADLAVEFSDPLPREYANLEISVDRISGRINRMRMTTSPDAGDLIVARLTEKFGPPKTSGVASFQNGYGASFQETRANWEFSDGATLAFSSGIDLRVNPGRLIGVAGAVVHEQEAAQAARKERGL